MLASQRRAKSSASRFPGRARVTRAASTATNCICIACAMRVTISSCICKRSVRSASN